jgi:hypothetical protein
MSEEMKPRDYEDGGDIEHNSTNILAKAIEIGYLSSVDYSPILLGAHAQACAVDSQAPAVFTRHVIVLTRNQDSCVKVLEETIASANGKVTGFAGFFPPVVEGGAWEVRVCIEASMQVLNKLAEGIQQHEDVVNVQWQGPARPLESHFYSNFDYNLQPGIRLKR